jgi:hypothetical protein
MSLHASPSMDLSFMTTFVGSCGHTVTAARSGRIATNREPVKQRAGLPVTCSASGWPIRGRRWIGAA